MSKEKLSASEWEMVKYAPYWVNQALAEADGRVSFFTKRRESKTFEKVIKEYKSGNALVNDIIKDDSDAPKTIGKASQADAEKALNQIAAIVEQKLGADDLKALSDFLLKVGHSVANASLDGGAGNAKPVSEKEAAALLRIESALKVSASYATAHAATAAAAAMTQPVPAAKPSSSAKPVPAPARDDEADKKKEQEKNLAEARERQEKAREQAEAEKKEAAAKERLEAARKETEERQQAAAAEREAKEKAEAEAARKEAEAKAAAAAPKYTQFIAEHTVQPGDNLSFISQKYYGHQGNFRIIYEANKDVIGDNMNLIRPGQVLKIPKL